MIRIIRRAGLLLAALAVALVAGFPASPAAAADGDRSARVLIPDFPKLFKQGQKKNSPFVSRRGVFRVKLVGYQVSRWSVNSPSDGVCVGSTEGGGVERVVFRQPFKRMKLSGFGIRRVTSMVLPTLKVRGQLTRRGSTTYTPLANPDPDCPYGDGGGGPSEPIAPDCGTRKFRGIPMSLFALDGFFRLRSEAELENRPRFRKCPPPRVAWPSIITKRTNGKEIRTRLPGNLVFNRKFDRKTGKWSKVIVIAKGVARQRSMTSASTTRLQWTLTLKRLR